ncbi:MAG: pilus assembly protein PilM [Candidatus Omnitrophica bacterium]|nr:pilus assembly protein PilM [Candidatus Omnitrophota bacterium]
MFFKNFKKLNFHGINFQKPSVVVEIGNDWIKIAEIARSSSGVEISKLSLLKLAQIKDNISTAIANIFRESGLERQHVTLCIPRHLMTVRVLDLPSVDLKEINDMINLQVGKQTPYSKDEIISAHKIIYSEKEGYTKVMLAIVQRTIVNERIEELKSAGVSVGKVFISSEGVYNWFSFSCLPEIKAADTDTIAVLDIDSNYSDFITIYKGKMSFTKNIFIGSNHLSEAAGTWKDKLIEELDRCLKRYYIEEKNTRIEKLFITGATRDINDLGLILSNTLAIQAEKTDAMRNIAVKKDVRAAQGDSMAFVSLSSIAGTVMREGQFDLDFTPGEHKILKMMEKKRKDLVIMGVLCLSIVMVVTFFLFVSFYYKSMYLYRLKKHVKEISSEAGEIEKMKLGIDLVKDNLDTKNSSLGILHEIYKITPSDISLGSIYISENKQVVIKGRGFEMSDVFKFIKSLEDSKMFTNVKASYTRTKREKEGDKDVEYAEFEITCPHERR